MRSRKAGSIAGTLLGILVFLAGVALLALVFKLAIDMFGVEPSKLFGLDQKPGPGGKPAPLDLSKTVTLLMAVLVRVLLLLVMALVGGVIANRGIKMFADSRWGAEPARPRRKETVESGS